MATLQIALFGPPRIAVAGAPVRVPLDKALALLAYLAVTHSAHRRDHLAAQLWPECGQTRARAYLRNALYTLTHACGDRYFLADRSTIELAPDQPLQVDVWEFLAQITAARRAVSDTDAIAHLVRAAMLAEAGFLAGFSLPDAPDFDEWQTLEGANLRRKLDEALQDLVALYQAQGDFAAAIEYAQRWVALDPLNEPAHAALMHTLALSGQTAAALRQYDDVARVLDVELGVAPSDAITALYRALQEEAQTDGAALDGHAPRVATGQPQAVPGIPAKPVPYNLPHQPTPFVGRDRELDELDRLLAAEDGRLITIAGPGGMGKTRLALACAERQVQRRHFPDGVYFVELAALPGADLIAPTIAAALGCVPESGAAQQRPVARQVVDFLAAKRLLLVLDNFEHLLAGTELVHAILQGAPGVRLLVTSREWLHMRAEQVYTIDGLAYDDLAEQDAATATPAVQLFLQCARRNASAFRAEGLQRAQVAEICRLVEGMPLAIELAAAWTDLLTPTEIADEIRRNLTFLQADMRDVPPRHHSIRAAFDATWQRLDAAERAVFAALSVFRGGFTREAASAVAGATLGQLRELTLKSLLQPDRRHLLPHNRFVIHELLRQYGALMLPERPGGAGRAHALHCTYFCAWLAARLEPINGPQQRQAADDIAEELDNVRAAWQWAVEQVDLDAIHEAATTLFLFCQLRSHFLDGAEMMAAAAAALRTLAASHLRDLTLAQLLNHEGWLRIRLGDFARAAAVLAESRALYSRPDVPPPPAYMGTDPTPPLAIVAHIRGDHAAALALGEEALQAATARGDRYNQSYAHYALTSAHAGHGDYTAAAYHAQQACALAEAVGNRWFLAILRNEWGKVARAVEDYAQAGEHFRTSYAIKAAFDDPEGMAVALNHLGEIAILQHDLAEAGRLHRQALAIYEGIGDRVGLATALRGLAQVAGAQGATAEAWRGYGEALAIAEDTQFLPLVFAILVDLGALLLQRGGVVSGLQALLQVRQHAAADHEMRTRAEHCLAAWQDQVDPALYAAALQNTRQTDLAATLRVLQAAFGVPGRSDAAT